MDYEDRRKESVRLIRAFRSILDENVVSRKEAIRIKRRAEKLISPIPCLKEKQHEIT